MLACWTVHLCTVDYDGSLGQEWSYSLVYHSQTLFMQGLIVFIISAHAERVWCTQVSKSRLILTSSMVSVKNIHRGANVIIVNLQFC